MEDNNMYKAILTLSLVYAVLISSLTYAEQDSKIDDYNATIKAFKSDPDVVDFFDRAYGYAIFPVVGKGGLGIGAAHGKGQVYKAGKVTGKASVTQLSVGFQAGGQAYSQIIFFEDERAYKDFTKGSFEFGAQATAVAVTASAQASASTTGKTAGASTGGAAGKQAKTEYYKGLVTFVYARGGFMHEVTLSGQKYSFAPLKEK
jgi:lipid-binding SYLF domain-containing protein